MLVVDQDHPGIGAIEATRTDIPACSRFFGKPLEAGQMITELHSMIDQT
jgi:hypothetical protein